MRQRLLKWEADNSLPNYYANQLLEEWHCICRATGFEGGFLAWVSQYPELVELPFDLPTASFMYDLQQILKFHVDAVVASHLTKQKKLAQFVRQQDAKRYGRAKAFQSVKEQGAGLMTDLLTRKQWDVQCVNPPEYGLLTVQVPDQCQLDGFTGLTLNQQPVDFIQWNAPFLEVMLHDPDQPIAETAQLSQQQRTSVPSEVAQLLDQHWRQYWDRDLHQDPSTLWQPLQNRIANMVAPEPVDLPLYELSVWKSAIKGLKSKTARGVCAWSADELKGLPDVCIQALIEAFQKIEHTGMGRDLMAARTVPLRKKPGSKDPADTRPITVLSLLYRLWGKVLSSSVLRHWQTFFPKAITGFLPHRSAVMPMYQLQHKLEVATHTNLTQWTGLTLDIRKCFNCLPIPPTVDLLVRLGVPLSHAKFWFESIQVLDRHWQIQNQIYATGLVSTGVPEGDAVSVLIMLAYNYIWTTEISQVTCDANAYADNWAYAVDSVATHQSVLPPMLTLISDMRLQVDWTKTWIWVTHDSLKDPLRRLLSTILPQDVELQLVPHAKDLGFILHYRRKQLRTPQKDRHQKALTTLRRVQKTAHDHDTKALIAQCAITKALYGAHTHVTSEQTCRELRAAIADILVGTHRNVNGYLAVNLLSPMVTDPELYVIAQSFRFARDFLIHAGDADRQSFLTFAARRTHKPGQVTGPSGALALYLAKLGWQITVDGFLLIAAFFQLHITDSPWETLQEAMHHAWMEHISIQVSNRKGYRGIPVIDAEATQKIFQRLPTHVKKIASYAITGGYMLDGQKAKFDEQSSTICHYCEQDTDTAVHRVLHCSLTDPVRLQYPATCEYFQQHDDILVTCPAVYVDPEWELHRQLWFAMPDPPLHLPPHTMHCPIYTDGSCQMPDRPRFRYACYAAVCWNPATLSLPDLLALSSEDRLMNHFHTVAVATLSGRQTIARAELYIVVLLAEAKVQGPIYSDSMYVLNTHDTHALILATPNWRDLHMKPNYDLLYRWHCVIWRSHHDVPVYKVAAHETLSINTPAAELYHQMGNDAADTAAKLAARNLAVSRHRALHQLADEQATHKKFLREQFLLRYDLALLCIQYDKPAVALNSGGDPFAFMQQMRTWWFTEEPRKFVLATMDTETVQASRWGTPFTDLLLQWLQSLSWSKPDTASPPLGVSWIELICNFLITTQSQIPVNVAAYKQQPNYLTTDQTDAFDLSIYPFSHTIMSFQRAIQHVQHLTQTKLLPDSGKVKTGSLYYMGFGSCRNGLASRPVMQLQAETIDFLWQYAAQNRSEGKVVFEKVPVPPPREPIFTCTIVRPSDDTHKARATRYHRWRVRTQQSRQEIEIADG